MSITNYSELQTAIQNWTGRSDLAARIPEWIALFEAAANRKLRTRDMELTAALTPDVNGSATLPSDYLAWRRVTWTGSPRMELEYVEPSWLQAAFTDQPVDTPRVFTIEGGTLKVMPLDSTALEFLYYQKLPPLASSGTNWMLNSHPDLYLFGTLVEAEMFGVNDERAGTWKARRDELFADLDLLSRKTRGAGAIRIMGVTP